MAFTNAEEAKDHIEAHLQLYFRLSANGDIASLLQVCEIARLCQEVGMDKVRFGSPHLLEYTQQIVMEGIQMALNLNNTRRTMLEEHFADLRKLDQWHRSEYPVLSWNPQLLKEFAPDNSI